jgi:hypothetical protein
MTFAIIKKSLTRRDPCAAGYFSSAHCAILGKIAKIAEFIGKIAISLANSKSRNCASRAKMSHLAGGKLWVGTMKGRSDVYFPPFLRAGWRLNRAAIDRAESFRPFRVSS